MKEVYLYSRPQCHLCEEAKLVLQMVGEDTPFTLHEINIDDSDEWTEKYGLMIPVVEYNKRIIQYGIVDYPTIKEALSQ